MRKLFQILLLIAIVNVAFLSGCKISNEDPAPNDNFATLTNYMASNSMDLSDILSSWIVAAPTAVNDVQVFVDNYYIIDLRSAADFAVGHIQGAVNSTFGNVLATASGASKPILVVCYTGQTAGHAVVALRLSGYSDAVVLKWGMSGWNSSTAGSWNGNIGDAAVGHANWSETNTIKSSESFEFPSISSSATDGAGILAERVALLLTGGFKAVGNSDVLDSPSNYQINNFWAETDVDHYGHITGAYRINPLSLANINSMDPSKTVVTYCWTGQTSSMVTAYLTVLGYNATSLKFGTNGMIYSKLESHQFVTPAVDLPLAQN